MCNAQARVGQPIILFQASTHDGAQDFSYDDDGTVDDFYNVGLVSGGLELRYARNFAFEAEFTPYGYPTNLCVGRPGGPLEDAGQPAAVRRDLEDRLGRGRAGVELPALGRQ